MSKVKSCDCWVAVTKDSIRAFAAIRSFLTKTNKERKTHDENQSN